MKKKSSKYKVEKHCYLLHSPRLLLRSFVREWMLLTMTVEKATIKSLLHGQNFEVSTSIIQTRDSGECCCEWTCWRPLNEITSESCEEKVDNSQILKPLVEENWRAYQGGTCWISFQDGIIDSQAAMKSLLVSQMVCETVHKIIKLSQPSVSCQSWIFIFSHFKTHGRVFAVEGEWWEDGNRRLVVVFLIII